MTIIARSIDVVGRGPGQILAAPLVRPALVVAGLTATLAIAVWVGEDLRQHLGWATAGWLGGGAILLTLMPIFAARRWMRILRSMAVAGVEFKRVVRAMMLLRFVGLFTSVLAADIAGRFALIAPSTDRKRAVALSLGADRGLDGLYALALVPCAGLVLAGASGTWVTLLLVGSIVAPGVAVSVTRRLPFAPRRLVGVARLWWYTVARNLCLALATFTVMAALSLELSLTAAIAITALSQLTAAVALSPGAWGFLEAGWIGMLTAAGVPLGDAAAFAVLQRGLQTVTFGLGASAVMLAALGTTPAPARVGTREAGL